MKRSRPWASPLSRASLGLAVLGALVASRGTAAGDDTIFLSAQAEPNVLLMVDSSGSMNGIMYHKAWPGGGSPSCDVIPPGFSGTSDIFDDNGDPIRARCAGSGCRLEVRSSSPDFVPTPGLLGSQKSGYVQRRFCGQARKIFHDGNVEDRGNDSDYSRWFDPYIDWYFSLDPSDTTTTYGPDAQTAAEILAEIDQDDNGVNYITGATFPLYKRARITAATEVAKEVIYRTNSRCPPYLGDCGIYENNVRFGISQFAPGSHGGYVKADIGDYAGPGGNKSELEAALDSIDASGSTPLGETLFKLYTYFMSRTDGERVRVTVGTTTKEFPKYDYRLSNGDGDAPSSDSTKDPVDLECRNNSIIILTDGEPGQDDFRTSGNDTDGFGNFDFLIGDYASDMAGDPDIGTDSTPENGSPWIDSRGAGYLDDIALFMQDHDLRPVEYPNTKNLVDVYTVGFGVTGAPVQSLLQKTADNGNGIFRNASQAEELVAGLLESLTHILEKINSFTAATVASARTAEGGAFFNSFFLPSGSSAFWQGHLRAWTVDAVGDIKDANGDCALVDPDPGECNSGAFKPRCVGAPDPDCAVPFWDAGEQVPAHSARNLYVSRLVSGSPTRVDFDSSLQAADLDIQTFAVPPAPAPNSARYPVKGSTAVNEEGLADEVVAYARGCNFGTGVTSADVSVPRACVQRPWLLGDIFHSNPIVITRPRQLILEPSYGEFQEAYDARSRVIFAGTNGGWLEAFHAGSFDANTRKYDAGTGAELFGFMPWQSRKKIKNQPIDFPTSRTHYIDGALQAADAWIHPTPTASVKAANGSEWRTILMGGMRSGGTQYFALDVTNPDDIVGPHGSSLPYPNYLWEFPAENDSTSTPSYMGGTWGTPIITRVRVEVMDDDGPDNLGYERWVAVITAGYDPESDPNPTAVSNLASMPYVDDSTKGRAVYIVDLKTGGVLAEKKFTGTASDCPDANDSDPEKNMCFAFVGSPTVLDLDSDGFADVIFLVDMGGQVFKWVIKDIGEDRVNDGSDLRTQPSWPFRRWFKAPVENLGGDLYYKNLFFPPAATYVNGTLFIALASGERLHTGYPGDGNADDPDGDDENNRFWVITDIDPYELGGLAELGESDLALATGEGAVSFSNRGFYFKAEDGEKWVTNIAIFAGDVIAASFTPTDIANACTAGGNATLYAFDVKTGEGQFEDNANNPLRGIAIGTGLPADPKISIGVGGTDTRIIIEKSGADFDSQEGKDVDMGGRLLYWRER